MPVTRGGRTKSSDEPERRCIVTGESKPRSGLVRFVVGPGDVIVADVAGKLPGRGVWVSSDRQAIDKAAAKNLFARALRQKVGVPENLAASVEDQIARRLIDLVSLARKGGTAIAGFEKVLEASVAGRVAVLLQARDGSDAQKGKIRPPNGENALVSCLSGQELGLAFGRENVIHAALAAGGLAERIVEEGARLAGLRNTGHPERTNDSDEKSEHEGDGYV